MRTSLILRPALFVALSVCLLTLPASGFVSAETVKRTYTEERVPCAEYYPNNAVHWGDLHVHTAYSLDASTQDTRTTPSQAYAFAQGEPLGIQPWTEGKAQRTMKIGRPLDFAAVTDHAELLGEVEICSTPGMDGYDGWSCSVYRWFPRVSFFLFNSIASSGGRLGFCGKEGEICREGARGPWQDTQQSAEASYDRSEACQFTSFVAYEWTGVSENVGNLHRNVIFRNSEVPDLPISYIDSDKLAVNLYQQLDEACIEANGSCDVLVIPHNSNISDGYMFKQEREDGSPITEDDASQRSRFETLVELFQHKGSSECFYRAGISEDELCAFEQLPYDKFSGKFQSWARQDPQPDDGFMREVLRDGMREQQRLGVNPFKTGFIGSTDTHLGAPGAVSETDFYGHGGAGVPANEEIPAGLVDDLEYNPGGLAGVWAPENSRDALFDAMRRRETFATSGPRIELRFFAGSELQAGLCQDPDMIAKAYANGVPMGATVTGAESGRFLLAARRDAGSESELSMPLQQLQIIKGWVDADGQGHEKVVEVAGNPDNGATVDTASCRTQGEGYDNLCAVWQDPEFAPSQLAYYYARAVENPSCRWSQQICVANAVDCSNPDSIGEGLEGCCDALHRPTIQERAVSSPIWYSPDQ